LTVTVAQHESVLPFDQIQNPHHARPSHHSATTVTPLGFDHLFFFLVFTNSQELEV